MKAGKSSEIAMRLAELRRRTRLRGFEGRVVGGDAADQFDQLHHRHRIHEMNADEFSGRSVVAASRVIEIDEVLEATIASGFRTAHRSIEDLALDLFLLGRGLDDQVAVGERRPCVSAADDRLSAFLRASAVIGSSPTWRVRLLLMVSSAQQMLGATSLIDELGPASAQTWAMPLPIWPAPMTPTSVFALRHVPATRCTAAIVDQGIFLPALPIGAETAGYFGLFQLRGEFGQRLRTGRRPARSRRPGRSAPPRPC